MGWVLKHWMCLSWFCVESRQKSIRIVILWDANLQPAAPHSQLVRVCVDTQLDFDMLHIQESHGCISAPILKPYLHHLLYFTNHKVTMNHLGHESSVCAVFTPTNQNSGESAVVWGTIIMTSSAHLLTVFDFDFGQPCSPHYAPLQMLFSAWILCLNKFLSLLFFLIILKCNMAAMVALPSSSLFLWFKTPTKSNFSSSSTFCLFIAS